MRFISLVFVVMFFLNFFIAFAQSDAPMKMDIYIFGQSKYLYDKEDFKKKESYQFWINGVMEFKKEGSADCLFLYDIKDLNLRYNYSKEIIDKDPPKKCDKGLVMKFDEKGKVIPIPDTSAHEMQLFYCFGIQKKILDELKNLGLPLPDLPPDAILAARGTYELELDSVQQTLLGTAEKLTGNICPEMPTSTTIDVGDVEISGIVNENGTLSGHQKWSDKKYSGNITRFRVECKECNQSDDYEPGEVEYEMRWTFTITGNCLYRMQKALSQVKKKIHPENYSRLFCLIHNMLEETADARFYSIYKIKPVISILEAEDVLQNKTIDIRQRLIEICEIAKDDEELLIKKLEALDKEIKDVIGFFYQGENLLGDLSPGQIYIKDYLVELSKNENHFLHCYFE